MPRRIGPLARVVALAASLVVAVVARHVVAVAVIGANSGTVIRPGTLVLGRATISRPRRAAARGRRLEVTRPATASSGTARSSYGPFTRHRHLDGQGELDIRR